MTEHQIDALQVLLRSQPTLDALHQLFSEVVEVEKPQVTDNTDAVVGQKYRAYDTAKNIIAKAFTEMEQHRKERPERENNIRHL